MGQDRHTPISLGTFRAICADGVDVLVIGAGVAGAAAAAGAARRLGPGKRVVLVERCAWPRAKVCGSCLNHAAVELLSEIDLGPERLLAHGTSLQRVDVRCGPHTAGWRMPPGIAIDRSRLDDLLVEQAVLAGAVFAHPCSARVERSDRGERGRPAAFRAVLRTAEGEAACNPALILVADGLGSATLSALPEFQAQITPGSWIGFGARIDDGSAVPEGTVVMNIAGHGYVGLVRMPDGEVNMAAAADPSWIKSTGGPHAAARAILERCGVPLLRDGAREIRGTPMLTRRRRVVAAPGLFVLGDAAGYVEPFTGEGMAWALASARAAAELGAEVINRGDARAMSLAVESWHRWNRSAVGRRQWPSRVVRAIVHRPALASVAVRLMAGAAWRAAAAGSVATALAAPYPRLACSMGQAPVPGDAL